MLNITMKYYVQSTLEKILSLSLPLEIFKMFVGCCYNQAANLLAFGLSHRMVNPFFLFQVRRKSDTNISK